MRSSTLVFVTSILLLAAVCPRGWPNQVQAQVAIHPVAGGQAAEYRSVKPADSELAAWLERSVRQQHQLSEQAARIERLERALNSREPTWPISVSQQMLLASDRLNQDDAIEPADDICKHAAGCDALPKRLPDLARELSDSYPLLSVGGQYRVMFNGANFDFHDATISNNPPSQSFFNQRFRSWLTVQTSDRVQGYVQMEIGHVLWGENFGFPKTYLGPRFPPADDRVGIEMRYGHLTYTGESGRWRAGIQDWQDAFGQTLASSDWDFSVGGLSWSTTLPALHDLRLLAGAYVLFEGNVRDADDAILWTVDSDWSDQSGNELGGSIYVVSDHGGYSYPTAAPYDSSWDVWFGLRGTMQTAAMPLHAFFLYNTGKRQELGATGDFEHHGYAAKIETGPQRFWIGQLRFQTLYSTGAGDPADRSSREFRTIAQSARDNFGAQGYWSYLAITSPHGPSDVNDLGVSLQNRGLGLFTSQVAFDYRISRRLSAILAVGWLNSDQPNPVSGSREMGTELLKMFTFDFGGGLKADLGGAVLIAGDFYKPAPAAPRPSAIWEAFSRVQLDF